MEGFVCLFDILLHNLMQLPCLSHGQIILASGDVLLTFDDSRIAFSNSGITGVAYPGPVEVASNHGVYIAPRTSSGENLHRVSDFLQKPTYDELKKCSGLDAVNRAFIDTGIMNFAIDAIETLMDASGIYLEDHGVAVKKGSLCEELINANARLDVYREIPFAILGKSIDAQLSHLLEMLHQIPFSVYLLPYCEFFHIGISTELIRNFHIINYTASKYGFRNFNRAKILDKSGLDSAFVYNSLLDTASVKANGLALIEGCHFEEGVLLDGENILTGIPGNSGKIHLGKGVCVTCVPVSRMGNDDSPRKEEKGWVSVIYGIDDDFRRLAEDDCATFLNIGFLSWTSSKGINVNDLWEDDEPHELWNARLFVFSRDPAESMQASLKLQPAYLNDSPLKSRESQWLEMWKGSPRMSLQEILQSVDYERLLSHYSELSRRINLESLAITLAHENDLSSGEVLSWCLEPEDYAKAARAISILIEESDDLLFQARLFKLLSNITREAQELGLPAAMSSIQYEDMAFELIREAIGRGLRMDSGRKSSFDQHPSSYDFPMELTIQIRSDEVVWVCAPARLDFAGGWTDTPPYCLEHGGSVLNAAVKLNGQYPIQAIGKLHPEPFIKINSIDLGKHVAVSEISEMLSYQDPTDWSALPKAAFSVAGIISQESESSLRGILERLGSGIDLTIFSAVPAGSGLGTSSILGSAIIACLSRILGQELSQEELFNRTLYMEQLMTTGGGWQDQIGGVVGGVKHIQTEPGLFQIPRISWTDLKVKPNMNLSERFLLYYTGYRRMAKNILRNIVGKYLDRDAVALKTLRQLRDKSFEMKAELGHRNIDAFGEKIHEVWRLNKTLDPGTSNQEIEAILDRISHLIHGAKLLGAGGGGFLFMVAKGSEQSKKVKEILEEYPPNDRARFFDFDVDQDGLKVSVL